MYPLSRHVKTNSSYYCLTFLLAFTYRLLSLLRMEFEFVNNFQILLFLRTKLVCFTRYNLALFSQKVDPVLQDYAWFLSISA